jgi:hypothetical protein
MEAHVRWHKADLGGLHVHHCFGELLNGVNASISDNCDNGEFSLQNARIASLRVAATTFSIPSGFHGLACTMNTISQSYV